MSATELENTGSESPEPTAEAAPDQVAAETPEPQPVAVAQAEAEPDAEPAAAAAPEPAAEAAPEPAAEPAPEPAAEAVVAALPEDSAETTPETAAEPAEAGPLAGWEALCAELEALTDGDIPVRLKDIQRSFEALGPLPAGGEEVAARFAAAAAAVRERFEAQGEELKRQRQQAESNNFARLTGLADRIDALVASEPFNLRKAERAIRDVQAALKDPGSLASRQDWPALRHRLEAGREGLAPRVRQLEQEEEWKRWANVPLQEELCARMEALIESEDLAHAANELRKASDEWKLVATVPREKSEELWQRFRAAREKVRERVSVFLAAQSDDRKDNLKRKIELAEKAEALVASPDWNTTADQLKALQTEWKAIGPVPRKHSEEIWQRFRKACDTYFEQRKEHFSSLDDARKQSYERKLALVEKAEALAESNEWESTSSKLRDMQAEWKKIGPVPRKYSEEIWQRFRKACDTFFERRSRKEELPFEANLAAREAICAELEALLPTAESSEAPEDLPNRLRDLLERWRGAGEVPRGKSRALQQRFGETVGRLMIAYPQQLSGTELDPTALAERRSKLVERAEALVAELRERLEARPDGSKASLGDLAARLQQALAANTIRRGANQAPGYDPRQDYREKLSGLRRRWQELPGHVEPALAARFDKVFEELESLKPPAST